MNLYLRLLALLGSYIVPRTPVPLTAETITRFRVLPHDLDTNLHMNNGRFLTLMDLGRLDYMAKVGMLWPVTKRKVQTVLGASQMVYLRPLLLGQRFELATKLECWDDKWFVMRQTFRLGQQTCAFGRVRGVFRHGGRSLPPGEVLEACGMGAVQSPTPSAATAGWLEGLKRRDD